MESDTAISANFQKPCYACWDWKRHLLEAPAKQVFWMLWNFCVHE